MERRFAVRYKQLMAEAEVRPEALEGVLKRLDEFVKPFAASLKHDAQRQHAAEYVAGLVSNVKRKNIETIAYLHEQDRQPMQKFIGQRPWDEGPMINEQVRQVAASIGRADGVLVIDPSGVLKQGKASVGVARQWCGRAGKVDNCQVGVYMAYVSRDEQALVDARLYLPKEWTKDKRRCMQAGIPREIKFHTRHELAMEMISNHRALLPHAWVTGDDEMGRNSGFRDELRTMNEQYPLAVEAVKVRVQTKRGRCNGPEETLVIFRERQGRKVVKHDYALSNAPFETPLREFARVLGAEHRVEECLRRAKGESGLAQYQVRTWRGWHHHQTLTLIATCF